MKIGIIISAFVNGGAQRVAITLSKWICSQKEQCCIIALNDSTDNQYDDDGVELVRLPHRYPGKNIFSRLRTFDRENKMDAYIVMGIPMCVYVIPALSGSKAKIVVSERNDPRNFQGKTITKLISRWLMGKADGFVFQTNEAKDFYKKYKTRSVVIPNPVAEVPLVVERLPNRQRKKEIVTAGRLVPQKNHEMLIKAFAQIASEFPEYRMVIYGEGVLMSDLVDLCNRIGIDDRIVFPGAVNDIHQKIMNSEIFVLSSDFEGMPNALMEAMAMGLTCISTDCPCGGPHDLIEDGTNGFLIPVGNIEKCSIAIKQAIVNKEKSDEVGMAALRTREEYSKDVICQRWMDYIHTAGIH